MEPWNYKRAGVDVEAGYEAVRLMKRYVERTYIPGVLGGLGGFGGLFALPSGYKEPVLISGTDGVGTKLMIAHQMGVHHTVGIDCVAMCVNDIACQGAKPLFFLDYIGSGVLNPQQAAAIVEGVSEGCVQAGCALIGGETAEMPGFYQPGEYDLAGFAVGIAEKEGLITGQRVTAGDVLIGVASAGLHSNGFSLVRKLCFEEAKLTCDQYRDELGETLGETLLRPTKIYVKLLQALQERLTLKGAAHITGGGWIENIPRLLGGQASSSSLKIVVNPDAAPVPPIFKLLGEWGHMEQKALYNVFNMGVGLVLAVDKTHVETALAIAAEVGEAAYVIGHVAVKAEGEGDIYFA